MKFLRLLAALPLAALFAACTPGGDAENYDTGYDTSNPYGTPSQGGYGAAPYQQVNPPADPTYGSAAYEETTPYTPTTPAAPSAPAIPSGATTSHTVVRGDTLWGLSQRYGVSADAIRSANGMAPDDNTIRLGQAINIPGQ